MTSYIAVATFPDNAVTYQALSDLARSAVASEITASALIERASDGTLSVPQGGDGDALAGTATGSIIGLLVGALGGPLGLLFGWGAGTLIGGLGDASRADDRESTLLALSDLVPAGRNALVLQVEEADPLALDHFVSDHAGTVVRRETSAVLADLEAQEEAVDAARDAANEKLREQRKAARHEKHEERIAKLRAKVSKN